MKFFNNRKIKTLVIIPVIIMVLLNVFVPTKVYATKAGEGVIQNFFENKVIGGLKSVIAAKTGISVNSDISGEYTWSFVPGNLLKEIMYLIVGIGDVIISLLQVVLIGDYDFWFSTMITNTNDNLENTTSWLYADSSDVTSLENNQTTSRGNMLIYASDAGLSGGIFNMEYEIPNIIYCPENIFSNKIAALDANFINPNRYNVITESSIFGIIKTDEAEKEAVSFASVISPTIATWYRAFRNLAIVGLLIVLVYTGIRIVIGSTAGEKAKYKERIQDWFVALCLVFFMHFIMAAIMMFTENFIDLFDTSVNSGIIVAVDDGAIFRTNFTGYIRFAAQSCTWKESLGYGIMYILIIGIIVRYTWIYLKRFFYLAFFTMIAPLVALTYPLDKMSDGNAQAYDKWFKEYLINALLQPMHLILYSALVSSAMTLCVKNPVYAIAVMMFISTAEDWVKKLFRMDEAKITSTSIGDVAMLGAIANIGKKVIGGTVNKVTNTAKMAAAAAATAATAGAAAPAAAAALGGTAAAAAGGAAAAGATSAGGTAIAGALIEGGVDAAAGALVEGGANIAGSMAEGVLSGEILESADLYSDVYEMEMYDAMDTDFKDMSTEEIRNKLSIQDMSSNEEAQYQDNEYIEQEESETSRNKNDRVGAGASTPRLENKELADAISQGVSKGMKDALDMKDNEAKEKEKQEKAKRDFIDASMQDSYTKGFKQKMGEAGTTMAGTFAGGVGGLFLGAMLGAKPKEMLQYTVAGATGLGNIASNIATETAESYLDVFREIKRKNLETLVNAVPQEEWDPKVAGRVAGMATRDPKNWTQERVVETYVNATNPQFQNLANDSEAINRFETYMRKTMGSAATQEKIDEAKRDIIEAQKPARKIKGVK